MPVIKHVAVNMPGTTSGKARFAGERTSLYCSELTLAQSWEWYKDMRCIRRMLKHMQNDNLC